MAYLVRITARAGRDLDHLYERINAEHSAAALKWYRGLYRAVLSLESNPRRGIVTHKTKELRHLPYGHKPHTYRVIFRILEKQNHVVILHIRHAARRKPRLQDIV